MRCILFLCRMVNAIQSGNNKLFWLMLTAINDIEMLNENDGFNILGQAIASGNSLMVLLLLNDERVDAQLLNVPPTGVTTWKSALLEAVISNLPDVFIVTPQAVVIRVSVVLTILKDRRFDVNGPDVPAALFVFVEHGKNECLAELLKNQNLNVFVSNRRGISLLHQAALVNNARAITLLCCRGHMDPNINNSNGNPPIVLAALRTYNASVLEFIHRGANITIDTQNSCKRLLAQQFIIKWSDALSNYKQYIADNGVARFTLLPRLPSVLKKMIFNFAW